MNIDRAQCLEPLKLATYLMSASGQSRHFGYGNGDRRGQLSQWRQLETYALQQIASYSITSSARATSVGGTSRPRALAVFILMASSNFVGCSTGRLAGLAPLKILCTNAAACRY